MAQTLFRILNLCWAVLIAGVFILLWVVEPVAATEPVLMFWCVYLAVAIGAFFDVRAAWIVCLLLLTTVWVMMGAVISDGSFVIFTGERFLPRNGARINIIIFNSFFGLTVPSSTLLILAFMSRGHIRWLFSDRRRRKAIRRRRAAV